MNESNQHTDFLNSKKRELENVFFSQISPALNKIVGLNPRDQFSVGLFLKLGVDFQFVQADEQQKLRISKAVIDSKSSGNVLIKHLMSRLGAYVQIITNDFQKNSAVVIKIAVLDENDMHETLETLGRNDIISMLGFVYLHEVQHILRKHNTASFGSLMNNIILKEKGQKYFDNLGHNAHRLINIAEDYAINLALVDMFDKTDTSVGHLVKDSGCLFDRKYADMNEIEILKNLLDDDEVMDNLPKNITVFLGDDEGSFEVGENGRLGKVFVPFSENKEGSNEKKSGTGEASLSDKEVEALSDALKSAIDKHSGKAGFKLNETIENSIEVDVRWFEKLQNGFYNFVNKKTKNSVASWNNLDSKLRHIYKSPTRRNIEKKVELIVSIDQSGSMNEDQLKKLLFLFEQKASVLGSVTLLFHDTDIQHIDIFNKGFKANEVIEAVSKRVCGGGTSHSSVFQWLDDNLKSREVKNKIYVSFSDNYSDIEEQYPKFANIKKISKVWLNSDGKNVDSNIGGLKVQFS